MTTVPREYGDKPQRIEKHSHEIGLFPVSTGINRNLQST